MAPMRCALRRSASQALTLVAVALAAAAPPLAARPIPQNLPQPQFLPAEARWCLADNRCIDLEVADEPAEQERGMQGRPPMPPLRGMWFPFRPPQRARFWMHLTQAPLDLLFLSQGQVAAILAAAPPCLQLPCVSYTTSWPVDGVIELAADQAASLGIRPGTPVRITPLRPAGLPLR